MHGYARGRHRPRDRVRRRKSGHVGRKIAATLASTGTPAFFVHAGEASHGDMGMIAKGDAVIAISNSGETGELRDVVAYTRRFGIPLIAITSRAQSSLAAGADVVLVLPPAGEACEIVEAPTTSTTTARPNKVAWDDRGAVPLCRRRWPPGSVRRAEPTRDRDRRRRVGCRRQSHRTPGRR